MERTKTFYSNGVPLSAILTLPNDASNKLPAVILCHGHSRCCNDGLDLLAQTLCENGIASLRFDFRGCTEQSVHRYHLYCASEWPDDLISALSFAQSLPIIDPNRLGVAGISMGASTAIYVAGLDERIKSVVSMAGIADCGQWLQGVWERSGGDWPAFLSRIQEDHKIASASGHSNVINVLEMYNETNEAKDAVILESLHELGINAYVSLDSLFNLLHYKPIEKCASIKCPVFFTHGAEDLLVPVENAHRMFNQVPNPAKRISVYEGVDHNIPRNAKREQVFKDIVAWFASSL